MFFTAIAIGQPVETPSNVPLKISALSGSFREVTDALNFPSGESCPGFRLSRAACNLAVSISIPLGQP